DQHAHRALPRDSEQARAVAVLARAQQHAVWDRVQVHNQLRQLLGDFYPAALAAFAGTGRATLDSPPARTILTAPPTPHPARPHPGRPRPPSPPTLTPRSSPASPAWACSPAPAWWPNSATTAPGSPTPRRSRPTPAPPRSPAPPDAGPWSARDEPATTGSWPPATGGR